MAQLVVAAAGAAIGSMFGAPQLGWVLGSMVGGALFAPDVEGPRLGDLRVSGTEYGQPIPWVAGSPRIAGQIVWASNKRETANTQSAKGSPEQTPYTYDCDLLILLTENEIAGVSRIWSNGELVWGNGQTKSGVWADLRVYTGAADQMPDPTYEAAVGAGNAPAYRGRGYVVIQGLQLGGSGQIPNLTFEVGTATPDSEVRLLPRFDGASPGLFFDSSIHHNTHNSPEADYSIDIAAFDGDSNWLLVPEISLAGVLTGTELKYTESDFGSFGPNLEDSDYTFEFYFYIPSLEVGENYVFFSVQTELQEVITFGLAIANGSPYGSLWPRISYNIPTGSSGVSSTFFISAISPSALVGNIVHFCYMKSASEQNIYFNGVKEGNFLHTTPPDLSVDRDVVSIKIGAKGTATVYGGNQFLMSNFRFSTRLQYDQNGFSVGSRPLTYLHSIVGSQTPQDLLTVLSGMFSRAQIDDSCVDLSGIIESENLVRALAVSNVASTRSTLDVLKTAYFLEASKSDKIYIRPRAVDPVATLPYADIGVSSDPGSDVAALELTKANDIEIPAQVALRYANMAADYGTATEYSDRVLSQQDSISTVSMPLGFLPVEAKSIADALIIDTASSIIRATIRVPMKYAYLEPGDVINVVDHDGRTYRLRIQTKRDSMIIIELECVLDVVGALDSAAVTDAGYISTAEPVRVAPTVFEALDIPLLRDADNAPGYYVAVGADRLSADDEWKGALVARGWDDTSYAELFRTVDEGVLATCSTTLGDWTGGNVWDESNTLTVVTSGGELASSTRSAMQADETLNVLAVGSQATGWELLRFRRAELTAPNTYVLSGFLRGFRGTEWRMGSHAAGEQAVLLNASLRRATSQTSQIGLARYIKAVTFNQALANVDSELFVDTGEALRTWAPVHPVALADDDGDLVLTWQRRTRLSYRYDGDSPAVPLGEAAELYRVRVYDGATLVRTATATEAAYLYTAAEQAADGFAPGDPVTFEICQVSETVGAGRPAICTGVAP